MVTSEKLQSRSSTFRCRFLRSSFGGCSCLAAVYRVNRGLLLWLNKLEFFLCRSQVNSPRCVYYYYYLLGTLQLH